MRELYSFRPKIDKADDASARICEPGSDYLGVKPHAEVLIVVNPETDRTMPRVLAASSLECGPGYNILIRLTRGGGEKATTHTNVMERLWKAPTSISV